MHARGVVGPAGHPGLDPALLRLRLALACGPSPHPSLQFAPPAAALCCPGRSPTSISPTLTGCPSIGSPARCPLPCPAPPRVPVSEPQPHGAAGAAELGGGLPQDPVSFPRGAEPGFRLRLRGVPPGGAQFRPEGEPGPGAGPTPGIGLFPRRPFCRRSLQSPRAAPLLCALHVSTSKIQPVGKCS